VRVFGIGIVGCGSICGIYLQNLGMFRRTRVVACADLDDAKARTAAEGCGARAVTVSDLCSSPEVDLVLNLTVPHAHAEVTKLALECGKHVYSEKPLAVEMEDGAALVEEARRAGLRLGCAPDTFLGAALQTCRQVLDSGEIGQPVGANAFMLCHGHESWHPSPEFYYEVGGGPMFDMGPYYLTALTSLLGPVAQVSGLARASFQQRTITSEAKRGTVVKVETPTHILGLMEFASGALAQITTSFDVWASELPAIEIYGTEGSLAVPDPNGFGGVVRVKRHDEREWREVPHRHRFSDNSRGLGVLDMVRAIEEGRPHRASGELAYHTLELMHGFLESAEQRRHVEIESRAERPSPMPAEGPHDDL
jgi:predicted dehydrogenase